MVALRVAVAVDDIASRMRQRLHALGDFDAREVVWQEGTARLLLHTHALQVRALEGWLVGNLDVQTDEAGRATLQFIFFLGDEREAGPHGSATINAATREAAQIADRWGRDLLRVLWEAVLDGIEASIETTSIQFGGRRVAVAGLFSTRKAFFVDLVAGDR